MKQIAKKQLGLTLIEILIALALAAGLSAAIFQVFLTNRVNIGLTESYSSVQESARVALDLIVRDFRMTGYQGCLKTDTPTFLNNLIDNTDTADYNSRLHDYGVRFDAIDNYEVSDGQIGGVTPILGTDVLFSRSALSADLYLQKTMLNKSSDVTVGGASEVLDLLVPGNTLLITSDCRTANFFTISASAQTTIDAKKVMVLKHDESVSGGPDNQSSQLSVPYQYGDKVFLMNSFAYFVAPSAVITDSAGNPVNSLYKFSQLGGANAFELVPYVDDLQLTYIYNSPSGVKGLYGSAEDITTILGSTRNLAEVVKGVEISIVASGNENVSAAALSGDIAGASAPDDGRLRKRYTRTVAFPNSAAIDREIRTVTE